MVKQSEMLIANKRAGFSMIELVLSIVIIAISVMTIPLMLSQSSNNDSFSIMQESILAARTKMGTILSHEWDTKSVEKNSSVTYIRVLDVQLGDSELDRNETVGNDNNRRIGHIKLSHRRRFHHGSDINKTFPTNGVDTNITALNQFNGEFLGNTLALDGIATEFDYVIRDFNMTTTVSYISDSADYSAQTMNDFNFSVSSSADITDVSKSTNIKMIDIWVQSESSKPFRLRAFSCNIGQTELLELSTQGL